MEVDFDGGTRYYSRVGVRTPTAYYEPRITAFGGLQREIGLVPGDYRAAAVSITFDNADGEFSRLRAEGSWRNRRYKVYLIDPDAGLASMSTAFIGRIDRWSITKEDCTIDAVDSIQQRLSRPLNFVLDSGFFHRMPDETPRELIPLVVGTISAPLGAVPAYLIEPHVEVAVYQYIACQGTAKSIDAVYAYGVLVDPGNYSINYISGPSGTVATAIEFTADPRIADDDTNPHVAWNGVGITDDDLVSGNPVGNGAEQLAKVLRLNGVDAAEIDATTVATAAAAFSVQQIGGAFVATDRDLTIGDVVRQFAESYNLQVFTTAHGLIGMTAPVTIVDESATLPEVTALQDVVRDSFQATGPTDVAATLGADYGYNWYSQGFLSHLDRTNPRQITALGENVKLSSEHPFIRESQAMTAVADGKLFFLREQRQVVNIQVPDTWYEQLDIGDLIRLTHFAGIGNAGYDRQIFRITGIGLQDINAGTLATVLTLVDLTAEPILIVHQSDFSQGPWRASDYFALGTPTRGRWRFGVAPTTDIAPPDVLIVGKTVVTARMQVAKPLAPNVIAGSTSMAASLNVEDIVESGLIAKWMFDEGSGTALGDSIYSMGTGNIDSVGAAVTGTGTVFTAELTIGSLIKAGGEIKRVIAIANATHLTVDSAWSSDITGQPFTVGASDGTIVSPSWVAEGLEFGSGRYVTIPLSQNPSGEYTLTIVFKFVSVAALQTLFTTQDGTGAGRAWLQTRDSITDRLQTNLGGPPVMEVSTTLSDGQWYMGTVKKAGTTVSLYLNAGTPVSASKAVLAADGLHVLGIGKDLSSNGFQGRMAWAMLYSRALSNAEIAQNYAALSTKILPGRGISL